MAQAILQGICRTSWGGTDPAPLLAAAIGTPRPGRSAQPLAGSLGLPSRRDRPGNTGEVSR